MTETLHKLALALVCYLEATWADKENAYKASLGDDFETPEVLAQEYRDAKVCLEDALAKCEAAGETDVLVMKACEALGVDYLPVVFRRIRSQIGFLTEKDTARLRKSFPDHMVLVRTGMGRKLCKVSEVDSYVRGLPEQDHLRDVCIPASPKPVQWHRVGYRSPEG